jgi:hypothetical protein
VAIVGVKINIFIPYSNHRNQLSFSSCDRNSASDILESLTPVQESASSSSSHETPSSDPGVHVLGITMTGRVMKFSVPSSVWESEKRFTSL